MKTWQSILVGLIIGFLGGVGTMQASLVRDVQDHTVRLGHMERDIQNESVQTEQRFDRVLRLMEGILESNRQLATELAIKRAEGK